MSMPIIKHIRALTLRGAGADYHDQGGDHWIDDHISTPMAKYPEYRQSRQSFGLNALTISLFRGIALVVLGDQAYTNYLEALGEWGRAMYSD